MRNYCKSCHWWIGQFGCEPGACYAPAGLGATGLPPTAGDNQKATGAHAVAAPPVGDLPQGALAYLDRPPNATACASCGWTEGHDAGCGDTGRPRIPVAVADPPQVQPTQGALATSGEAEREEAREIAHRIMTGLCRWPRGQHSAKCTEVRDAFVADRLAATPVAQRRPGRDNRAVVSKLMTSIGQDYERRNVHMVDRMAELLDAVDKEWAEYVEADRRGEP